MKRKSFKKTPNLKKKTIANLNSIMGGRPLYLIQLESKLRCDK